MLLNHGKIDFESKNFSVVDLDGSGDVSPQCVVFHGGGYNTGHNVWRYLGGDGPNTNVVNDVTLLADPTVDGVSICDFKRFSKSLDKYSSRHSLYDS